LFWYLSFDCTYVAVVCQFAFWLISSTDIKGKSRLLKFCYVPLLALPLPRAFLWQPLTVLTRQARQAACAINQSIFLRCLWLVADPYLLPKIIIRIVIGRSQITKVWLIYLMNVYDYDVTVAYWSNLKEKMKIPENYSSEKTCLTIWQTRECRLKGKYKKYFAKCHVQQFG
jgi:hypothetical protein